MDAQELESQKYATRDQIIRSNKDTKSKFTVDIELQNMRATELRKFLEL